MELILIFLSVCADLFEISQHSISITFIGGVTLVS